MKTNKIKLFSVIALFLIGLIAISGIAKADSVPVEIEKVYINDRAVEEGEIRGGINRGDEIEIEVKLGATGDDDNIVVQAEINGLDHDQDDVEAETDPITVKANKTYYVDENDGLVIKLPDRMDIKDNDETVQYALRIEVSNFRDDEATYNAILEVDPVRNGLTIKDVIFSPAYEVKAGHSLRAIARIKNVGRETEEDVKVNIEIPELKVADSDYMDELEDEDTETSEELYLWIPDCAPAGDYKAVVTVTFDDGDETVTEDHTVTVVESDACNVDVGKTIVALGSETQDITAGGESVVYPITLSNTGNSAKTYTLEATAGSWANVKVSPSLVVLEGGETKMVFASVSANEGSTAGEKVVGLTIKSDGKSVQDVTLKANIAEPESSGWDSAKKGLEVALIVLVVLLVIIGLIVGFSKLKGDDEDSEESQTYY